MPDWNLQAAIVTLVGYEMAVFGTVISGGDSNVEGLLIVAFLLFTPGALLTILIKLGDVSCGIIVAILTAVMLFVAGNIAFLQRQLL